MIAMMVIVAISRWCRTTSLTLSQPYFEKHWKYDVLKILDLVSHSIMSMKLSPKIFHYVHMIESHIVLYSINRWPTKQSTNNINDWIHERMYQFTWCTAGTHQYYKNNIKFLQIQWSKIFILSLLSCDIQSVLFYCYVRFS